jgi:hypothetical protein
MKKHMTLIGIGLLSLVGLITGCNHKAAPIKEGVIWKVRWAPESNIVTGLYREKMPDKPQPGQGGSYGVDMLGVLYPSFLEVRHVGSRDSHSQIIPLSQITWLEFGDGGVDIHKPSP